MLIFTVLDSHGGYIILDRGDAFYISLTILLSTVTVRNKLQFLN